MLTDHQTSIMVFYFLDLGKTVDLDDEFKTGETAIFQSSSLDLTPPSGGPASEGTIINIWHDKDILLHISIRRKEGVIVFNSRRAGADWDKEERIPLAGALHGPHTTIIVYDHGDQFQILTDYHTLHTIQKRIYENGKSFSYHSDATPAALSDQLAVTTIRSIGGSIPAGQVAPDN